MADEKKPEKSLEELRRMSYTELAEYFNDLPGYAVRKLSTALKPENYAILTDNSLTGEEMAKKLNSGKKTTSNYRDVLLRIGLATRKQLHVAPHEENCKLILEKLTCPMNYDELQEATGLAHFCVREGLIRLKAQKEVREFKLAEHYDLFGNFGKTVYFYKSCLEKDVAPFIAANIPLISECIENPDECQLRNDRGLSCNFTYHLKKSLSSKLFNEVSSYYRTEEAVRAYKKYHAAKVKHRTKDLEGKLEHT